MVLTLVALSDSGVLLRQRRSEEFNLPYEDLLTVERLRSRRCLDLHTRRAMQPLRVRCRRGDREAIEHGLRFVEVRVVDCWGAIIAPTLLDFEEELAREPMRMRQSSDNA